MALGQGVMIIIFHIRVAIGQGMMIFSPHHHGNRSKDDGKDFPITLAIGQSVLIMIFPIVVAIGQGMMIVMMLKARQKNQIRCLSNQWQTITAPSGSAPAGIWLVAKGREIQIVQQNQQQKLSSPK